MFASATPLLRKYISRKGFAPSDKYKPYHKKSFSSLISFSTISHKINEQTTSMSRTRSCSIKQPLEVTHQALITEGGTKIIGRISFILIVFASKPKYPCIVSAEGVAHNQNSKQVSRNSDGKWLRTKTLLKLQLQPC